MSKGLKTAGIVVSIIMVVFGVLLCIWPLTSGIAFAYVATIGFVIFGIYQIVVFVRTAPEFRSGWVLAGGIINIILGILLLFLGPLVTLNMIVYLIAFYSLFTGISQIASFGTLKRELALAGETGAGWVLVSGIINLILSLLLIFMPTISIWVLDIFIGIYLLMGGIAFLVDILSGQFGRRR